MIELELKLKSARIIDSGGFARHGLLGAWRGVSHFFSIKLGKGRFGAGVFLVFSGHFCRSLFIIFFTL